jgi:hypothetical protein
VRKQDPGFASAWEEAEESAADALEAEAWRRAVDGVPEPLISAGKVVHDDDGQALAIRRYSDILMLALLKAAPSASKTGPSSSTTLPMVSPIGWKRRDSGRLLKCRGLSPGFP